MIDPVSISVVIPAYNSEDFIEEAISSVTAQSVPVAEIIVVDDGSSDRTAAIATKMGVSVLRQAHRGISAARNLGIRAAKHEWIAFQDADDIWEARKIEYQSAAIKRYPNVGLVSCDLSQWNHGSSAPEKFSDVSVVDIDTVTVCIPEPSGDFLIERMKYNSPTMLIRRDLLLSVDLFDENVRYVEGVECYLRVIARCPIVLIQLPLVSQRLHGRNTSADSVGMRLAWISMVERLGAEPARYPLGAAEALGRGVSDEFIPLGRALLVDGRMREARSLLARGFKEKHSLRALFLWALSFLNRANFNRLLAIKRTLRAVTGRFRLRQPVSASGRAR